MFARLLLVISIALAGIAPGWAQSGLGVVLMHGKGGRPGGNIGGLAAALEAEGVKVVMPTMAWTGTRGEPAGYDITYEQALAEIDAAVAKLRAQGAKRIVIAGQSLGANAAIAYVSRKPAGIAGVIALAPGHTPERMRRPEIIEAVARARDLVGKGQGATRASWPDLNVGQAFNVSGTASAYFSYFNPDGLALMSRNASRIGVPFLYVIGTSDPLHPAGRGYIFGQAKPNPKSRYVEVNAGHFDTPDKAKADVIAWLKAL